jgi:hypothetical protein
MKTNKVFTIIMAIALAMLTFSNISPTPGQRPKPKITTPTISCSANNDGTITVTVCAPSGGTGLPAGFSVQWMTCDQFTACGWPPDSGNPSGDGCNRSSFCKASFSGNANGTQWNLQPGQCIGVNIGGLNDADPGVSFTCATLDCNQCYVFRAFGHATRDNQRSDFVGNDGSIRCTTSSCGWAPNFCTKSQGYLGNEGVRDGTVACALNWLGGTVTIGINDGNGPAHHAEWTTVAAINAFLPKGGTSAALGNDSSNNSPPMSGGGTLAGQTLALTLNIAVSDAGCTNNCTGLAYPSGFGDARLCNFQAGDFFQNSANALTAAQAAALNGKTIRQVLADANIALGTGTLPPYVSSFGMLNELISVLNLSFDPGNVPGECCGHSAFANAHICRP